MSNNQRIERMAAEKAAADRERKEKAAQRKARPSRSRSSATEPPPGRIRVVWSVCNHWGEQVKTFPYPEKEQAEAEATRLSEQQERRHYVEPRKIPME